MAARRVLLVDDEPKVLRAFSRVLRREGYHVDTHDSGFGLTVALRQFRPDVVLLDINMPGLSGDAAIRASTQVLNLAPAPKLMIVSGMNEDELAARAAALGACAYLAKPVSSERLRDAVREVFDRVPQVGT